MLKYEVFVLRPVSQYLPSSCSRAYSFSIGMYALRERRQHVTQEDFEFAIAKVLKKNQEGNTSVNKLFS